MWRDSASAIFKTTGTNVRRKSASKIFYRFIPCHGTKWMKCLFTDFKRSIHGLCLHWIRVCTCKVLSPVSIRSCQTCLCAKLQSKERTSMDSWWAIESSTWFLIDIKLRFEKETTFNQLTQARAVSRTVDSQFNYNSPYMLDEFELKIIHFADAHKHTK